MGNHIVKKVMEKQQEELMKANLACVETYGPEVEQSYRPAFYSEKMRSLMCPAYWDKIYCWPDTPANTTAVTSCPSYLTGFIETQNATRFCTANGTWFFDKILNQTWTNYTDCYVTGHVTVYHGHSNQIDIPQKFKNMLPFIKTLTQTGYTASLISLIFAFSIMLCIRKLHCARNILHMNLFMSFILRAFMIMLKDVLFIHGVGMEKDLMVKNDSSYFNIDPETNNYECKLITSLVQYFTTANYSWILMEGLYLNNLIFRALFADSGRNVGQYIALGWGLPLVVILAWVTARIFAEDQFCWTTNDKTWVFMIIAVPTIFSIIINFILFIIISIVLYTKLRSPINEDSRTYQKWAKSTLVLVPLFGIHYAILLIFYFTRNQNEYLELIWFTADPIFGSFQGLFVALLYCFLNGEVKSEMKPFLYSGLTYLATNRYFRYCFPCRDQFLRSAVARMSVCTTMSCSSLYTNGIHRNSKSKWELFQKPKISNPSVLGEKGKDHSCQNGRKSSKSSQNNLNFINKQQNSQFGSNGTIETSLYLEPKQEKSHPEPLIIEEEICMLNQQN